MTHEPASGLAAPTDLAKFLMLTSASEALIGFVQEAISSPAAKRFDDYYAPRLRAAVAALASPPGEPGTARPTKVQRIYFHRVGSPHMEDTLDIPLGDDPKRHVADALIHRVLVVPGEPGLTLTERYWLDRRAQIIDALAYRGLRIMSDRDSVWLAGTDGFGEPGEPVSPEPTAYTVRWIGNEELK